MDELRQAFVAVELGAWGVAAAAVVMLVVAALSTRKQPEPEPEPMPGSKGWRCARCRLPSTVALRMTSCASGKSAVYCQEPFEPIP